MIIKLNSHIHNNLPYLYHHYFHLNLKNHKIHQTSFHHNRYSDRKNLNFFSIFYIDNPNHFTLHLNKFIDILSQIYHNFQKKTNHLQVLFFFFFFIHLSNHLETIHKI